MRITKTLLLSGKKETFDAADVLAVNRDFENVFTALQELDRRPRTVTSDPQHVTTSSRPKSNYVGETVYYTANLYFCTDTTVPTWKKITAI